MQFNSISIRPFIGTKNFSLSREFYRLLGFRELIIGEKMSYFEIGNNLGFYLQDFFVREWIENTVVFVELEEPDLFLSKIKKMRLDHHYENTLITEMKIEEWGKEFHLRDPAGILWHFGKFNSKKYDSKID